MKAPPCDVIRKKQQCFVVIRTTLPLRWFVSRSGMEGNVVFFRFL